MKTAIIGAHLVLEQEVLWNSRLLVEQGIITRIGEGIEEADHVVEANGQFVFPGFIDLHVHGANGFHIRDRSEEAIDGICSFHASQGTTSLLLTTTTMPREELNPLLTYMAGYNQDHPDYKGSRIRGIHLEGPFISHDYAGAQLKSSIQSISMELLQEYLKSAGGQIKLLTLAPELPGSEEAIKYLVTQKVVVSAGHSGATYDEMVQAIEWGVRHVTHFYNGMRGFLHREPGMLAAALLDDRVITEYICDFIHSHKAAGRLLLQNKGYSNIALITDAVREAGLYDGAITNAAGSLAGSTLSMGKAVRNAITELKVPLYAAAQMSSLTPAAIIGLKSSKGSIAVGKDADLVIMDSDFKVTSTIIAGKVVFG